MHLSDFSTPGQKPRYAVITICCVVLATSAFLIWGYRIKTEVLQIRLDYAAAVPVPDRLELTESIGRLEALVGFGIVLVALSVVANAAAGWYQWRMITSAHHEREAAKTDHFTGFLTRQVFMRAIRFGLNPDQSLGNAFGLVAVVSIDRFADIVAAHGIAVADNVAISVASVLRRLHLPGAQLCRFGESSFAIAVEGMPDGRTRAALASLNALIREDLARTRRKASDITASVGVSVAAGHGAEMLLQSAIVLNAQACDAGGNRVIAEGLSPPD